MSCAQSVSSKAIDGSSCVVCAVQHCIKQYRLLPFSVIVSLKSSDLRERHISGSKESNLESTACSYLTVALFIWYHRDCRA